MPDARILEWSDAVIHRPLVVVGFPSQGVVGGIAANFLIESTDMWLHATVHHDELPPVAAIRKGVAYSPIQIYAGAVRCGLGHDCDQLVVVRADAVPDIELWYPLADAILEWARSKDARLVVSLEGVKSGEDEEPSAAVHGLSTPAAVEHVRALGVELVDEGTISGFSASLLVKALERREKVVTLFVEAEEEKPDAEAAAGLLGRLDKLLPHIPIDPAPLLERARKIEDIIRGSMSGQRDAIEKIQDNVMYG